MRTAYKRWAIFSEQMYTVAIQIVCLWKLLHGSRNTKYPIIMLLFLGVCIQIYCLFFYTHSSENCIFISLLGRVWFLVYHQFSWCQFVINSVYIMLRDGYLVFIQFPFVCNASHDFLCIKLLIPHKISQVWYCIYLFSKIYKCTYKLYAFSL